MIVRVLFFAHLRERFGVREIEVELPAPASVEDLRRELCRRYPSFDGEYLRFAVNQAYVAIGHPLHDQDEVALIPPVSGGACKAPCREGDRGNLRRARLSEYRPCVRR
jgi:molybdopterin converting factor subunit 1